MDLVTRTVTGTIQDALGLAQTGNIIAKPVAVFGGGLITVLPQKTIIEPDVNGALSAELYTFDDDSTVQYEILMPDGSGFFIYLQQGTSVALETLRQLASVAVPSTDTLAAAITSAIKTTPVSNQIFPGFFPGQKYPSVYVSNSISGDNDLYTVPTGKKAVVFDYVATNNTGGTIAHYPQIKISGTYYRIGATQSDTAALGHNYGMTGSRGAPIVLNAGETFAINSNAVDLAIWANIIEFDDTSPLARADIKTWSVGNNSLFTVPTGKTVSFGIPGLASSNQPAVNVTGLLYVNNSGSSRTLSAIYLLPSGGSVGNQNQFAAPGTVSDKAIFSKYFHGNLAPGDQIILVVDSAAAGQFAWINYSLF